MRTLTTLRRFRLQHAAAVLLVATEPLWQQTRTHAQEPAAEQVSPRVANEAVDRAIMAMRWFYTESQQVRRPPPAESCDELAGEDCFGGQRECWGRCLPWPPGQPIRRLAHFYDSIAGIVARARPGADPDQLDWLAGQRVGVWARLRDLTRARAAAEECVSYEWWCEALRGFVDHLGGDPIAAEARFRKALQLMPKDLACYWNELVLYRDTLGPSAGHGGGRGACRPLDQNEGFWVLADPLFSRPGNDRLTEHYARHVDMRVHRQYLEKTSGTHPLWHHSVLLRYGWPTGYTGHGSGGGMVLTYGRNGQSLIINLSPDAALTAPHHVFVPGAVGATETYRVPYGPITAVPLQSGFFRRQGDPLLLIRSAAPRVSVGRLEWSLLSWNGTDWRDAAVNVRMDTLIAWLPTPWEPQIVSLEGVHRNGAFRARTGNAPPTSSGSAALSSIVIVDGADAAPGSLDEAARIMRPSTVVRNEDRVSAYWELYTAATRHGAIEVATLSLTRRGFIPRLFGRSPTARKVRWSEELKPTDGVYRRAIALDLHALEAGPYEITLTVTLDDGSVSSARTRIDVLR